MNYWSFEKAKNKALFFLSQTSGKFLIQDSVFLEPYAFAAAAADGPWGLVWVDSSLAFFWSGFPSWMNNWKEHCSLLPLFFVSALDSRVSPIPLCLDHNSFIKVVLLMMRHVKLLWGISHFFPSRIESTTKWRKRWCSRMMHHLLVLFISSNQGKAKSIHCQDFGEEAQAFHVFLVFRDIEEEEEDDEDSHGFDEYFLIDSPWSCWDCVAACPKWSRRRRWMLLLDNSIMEWGVWPLCKIDSLTTCQLNWSTCSKCFSCKFSLSYTRFLVRRTHSLWDIDWSIMNRFPMVITPMQAVIEPPHHSSTDNCSSNIDICSCVLLPTTKNYR